MYGWIYITIPIFLGSSCVCYSLTDWSVTISCKWGKFALSLRKATWKHHIFLIPGMKEISTVLPTASAWSILRQLHSIRLLKLAQHHRPIWLYHYTFEQWYPLILGTTKCTRAAQMASLHLHPKACWKRKRKFKQSSGIKPRATSCSHQQSTTELQPLNSTQTLIVQV